MYETHKISILSLESKLLIYAAIKHLHDDTFTRSSAQKNYKLGAPVSVAKEIYWPPLLA